MLTLLGSTISNNGDWSSWMWQTEGFSKFCLTFLNTFYELFRWIHNNNEYKQFKEMFHQAWKFNNVKQTN